MSVNTDEITRTGTVVEIIGRSDGFEEIIIKERGTGRLWTADVHPECLELNEGDVVTFFESEYNEPEFDEPGLATIF